MLELKNITKIYETADLKQTALNKVSINFRENEFVSILGPSGSGKTTLLNIIGGLDKYDSGNLIINEVSTEDFKDRDWDSYRNHRVGFVFQSYNLISHQSVLSNVELALTLSGISKKERKKRAKKALTEVGLKDHMNKRPNQLSGGQMQRVAIARALVNDPDIVLADEPTGALDTTTSEQIMKLLKKVASEKLVIMVTHNPDLAKKYSTRIIKIQDGEIIDDSKEYNGKVDTKESLEIEKRKSKKTSMSMRTALGLSLNNLMTKKGRTILTAFAGSIGIIGIALILSLSSGMHDYIIKTERETMAQYPLTISKQSVDMSSMSTTMSNMSSMVSDADATCEENRICTIDDIAGNPIFSIPTMIKENNTAALKKALDENYEDIEKEVLDIQYVYDLDLPIYSKTESGKVVQSNPNDMFDFIYTHGGKMGALLQTENAEMDVMGEATGGTSSMSLGGTAMSGAFSELISNESFLETQFDVLSGHMPEKYDEIVLITDDQGRFSLSTLYLLGMKDRLKLPDLLKRISSGEKVDKEHVNLEYDELIGKTLRVSLEKSLYGTKVTQLTPESVLAKMYANLDKYYENGFDIKVVGVVKTKSDSLYSGLFFGYTHALTEHVIKSLNDDKLLNLAEPKSINIYPKDYDAKDRVIEIIKKYNDSKELEEDKITYVDYVSMLMTGISTIIDVITAVLIAFVAISLVVSSIMIAIITYISVLERTKEIGILRAIGASKKDISRVFKAETIIEGFVAGVFGILATILLNIPANIIIESVTKTPNISSLPVVGAIALIIISVVLTTIAGLIPSRMASKKDPVDALRTE
ncbi:MAG: ATP-binding cassette domain-containing protein [Candidatus Saccharibacteria bacterium]|nr:ATP-binding cassette domain-containing protein [Candidatus Saccharibacteria bacterium]